MKIVKDTYPQLYEFQKEGVDFLANGRAKLLADDVGTGKTAQAIHACQQVGARSILVICTASIKDNWKKEGIKWGYDERDTHIITRENVSSVPKNPTGMYIINYDLAWRKPYAEVLLRRKFDVLICDEAHYLKNHAAKRTKVVWLSRGYADNATYRWMMTATPVLNRPVELHSMLAKLCPDRLGQYKNYIAYTQRYCDGHDGKWGYEALGAENLDELAGRLDGFMLRRTRDVLPDKTLQKIYMPFSKTIEKHLFTGSETESIRRKIGVGKVKPSAEHITNILESEEKIVVFAYHTDVIMGLKEQLKQFNPVVLHGATPSNKRQSVVEKFVSLPKCRILIGQIQAAGVGIDGLQHAASLAVFVEITHTPGEIKQAIGRLYREGQIHPCLFQFLMVEGTVDEQVLDSTLFKDKNIKTIMKDEKLGLDFSNPKKEQVMTVESELKRIADALEKLIELSADADKVSIDIGNSQTTTGAPPATQEPPKKRGRRAKTQAPAAPAAPTPPPAASPFPPDAPAGPSTDIPTTVEAYQARMKSVANRISTSTGDPTKTNAIFAKLQIRFQAQFPGIANVMVVAPQHYASVCQLVDALLKEEGVN